VVRPIEFGVIHQRACEVARISLGVNLPQLACLRNNGRTFERRSTSPTHGVGRGLAHGAKVCRHMRPWPPHRKSHPPWSSFNSTRMLQPCLATICLTAHRPICALGARPKLKEAGHHLGLNSAVVVLHGHLNTQSLACERSTHAPASARGCLACVAQQV